MNDARVGDVPDVEQHRPPLAGQDAHLHLGAVALVEQDAEPEPEQRGVALAVGLGAVVDAEPVVVVEHVEPRDPAELHVRAREPGQAQDAGHREGRSLHDLGCLSAAGGKQALRQDTYARGASSTMPLGWSAGAV